MREEVWLEMRIERGEGEEREVTLTRTKAVLRRGLEVTLFYREITEDSGQLLGKLRWTGEELEMTRRGAYESSLTFREGRETCGSFVSGPYRVDVRVRTASLTWTEGEGGIEADIRYLLEDSGMACHALIRVRDIQEEP